MNIEQHISEKHLNSTRSGGILCIIVGCCVPFAGVLLLALGIYMCAGYGRQKKEVAYLRQHPTATFAQMAHALGIKPERVRADMGLSLRQGIFVYAEVDTAGDCLRYLPVPKPAPPQGELVTISCPNCGAPVTISTKLGGQCEYCDTWLPGTE